MEKKYVFENREQLIELLSLCIELVNKHFYRYRVYYDELISMAKDKIKGDKQCRIIGIIFDILTWFIPDFK